MRTIVIDAEDSWLRIYDKPKQKVEKARRFNIFHYIVKNNLLYFLTCNMALKKAGGLNYIIMYKKRIVMSEENEKLKCEFKLARHECVVPIGCPLA